MPQQLALFICILFILWLFARDRKLRPMTSWALWIPLLWIMIIGSKPISLWFDVGAQFQRIEDYTEGSPLDRNASLLLIVVGMVALLRRRIDWGRVFASNRWVFAFFFYCLVSLIWSDYPFVGFKRWIKDVGNIVMVLIILTESDHVQAAKAVLARYTSFAIPLSVVFIKYFSGLGRYYNPFSGEAGYCGIASNKNELGCALFICGVFWVWDLLEMRSAGNRNRKTDRIDLLVRIALLLMLGWLMDKANSMTALMCLIIGAGIVLFMRFPFARRQVRYLGTYSLVVGLLIIALYTVPGIFETSMEMLGRDTTLTGRTDIWVACLSVPINPILGAGYRSFWQSPGTQRIFEQYYWRPVQAHNGYLEAYLNGGLVGVCLLIAMIISTGSKLKKELLLGSSFGILCFSFLVVGVFYSWTEALFNQLSIVWLIMLMAALKDLRSPGSMQEKRALNANGFR